MTARIILALVMLAFAGSYLAWRLIGTGKGAHAAPRWYTDDDEPTAVIPRVATEHAPPWEYQAAPVIEPAAVISGPPEPEAKAFIIAAGTVGDDGWPQWERVAVLPPLPSWTDELIEPVAAMLGYASTQDAVDAIFSQGHSVDSIFTKADARLVRELTDGRS